MDHTEALRLEAAEKYLLGELPKEQHAEYEEHYFDCSLCAEEIRATAALMESTRQVVREEAQQTIDDKALAPVAPRGRGWFDWVLRPAFAVPVFAALLVFVTYQNSVTIPGLKQTVSHTAVAEVAQHFSLPALSRRGGESQSKTIQIDPKKYFNLDVDMPGDSPSDYVCQILDASGKVRHTVVVTEDQSRKPVQIKIPAGSLEPGTYQLLAFQGNPAAPAADDKTPRQSFTIEFVR